MKALSICISIILLIFIFNCNLYAYDNLNQLNDKLNENNERAGNFLRGFSWFLFGSALFLEIGGMPFIMKNPTETNLKMLKTLNYIVIGGGISATIFTIPLFDGKD